jgi:hypothetical protein
MASLVWTTQLNTTGITKVNALAATAPIFIAGTTNLSVIGSESGDSSIDSTYSAFIISYTSTNTISFTKRINGSGDDSATCIKFYGGFAYMGGNTSSQQLTWGIDEETLTLSETDDNLQGTVDGFAVKYIIDGSIKWGDRLTNSEPDNITAIDVDDTYMYLGNKSVLLICDTKGDSYNKIQIEETMDIGSDTTIHSITTNNLESSKYVIYIGGQTYGQRIGNETTDDNLLGSSNGYIYAYSTTASPWLQRIGQNNNTSVTRIIYTTDGYVYAAGKTTSTLRRHRPLISTSFEI